MSLPDYSTWLTHDRLGKEETSWASAKLHLTYAAHIALLRSRFPIYHILELGCGTGWVPTQLTPDIEYVGFDKNEEALALARLKNLSARHFVIGDVRGLTKEGLNPLISPDLVCSFAVLKHFGLDEWNSIFDKMVCLAPLGLFTMSLAKENRDDGVDFHHVWITEEWLNEALERNGRNLLYSTRAWQGETWERKTGEEWIFAVGQR